MRITIGTKIAAIVGLLALLAAGLSFFAVYQSKIDEQQADSMQEAVDIAIDAGGSAQAVEHSVSQVGVLLTADDIGEAKIESQALRDSLREVDQRRSLLLSSPGNPLSGARKHRLDLQVTEFIAYQMDTAKMCIEVSPKAAMIQANDPPTVHSRQNMLAEVNRLSSDALEGARKARAEARLARQARIALMQIIPTCVIAVGLFLAARFPDAISSSRSIDCGSAFKRWPTTILTRISRIASSR